MSVRNMSKTTASSTSVGGTIAHEFLLLMKDSSSKRRMRFLKLMLVLFVPMAVLVLQCTWVITTAVRNKAEAAQTTETITTTVQMAEIVTRLQRERGMTSLFLSSRSPETWKNMLSLRNLSDAGIDAVKHWPGNENDEPMFATQMAFRSYVKTSRVSQDSNATAFEAVVWFINTIAGTTNMMNRNIRLSGDSGGDLWKYLFAYESFINAKENWGIQRAVGSAYFGKGYHEPVENKLFYEAYLKAQTITRLCFDHSSRSELLYDKLVSSRRNLVQYVERTRNTILGIPVIPADTQAGLDWFGNMTDFMDLISGIGTDLTAAIQERLYAQVTAAQAELSQALTFLIVVAVVCPPLCVWYFVSVNRINRNLGTSAKTLASKTTEISAEKRKGEKLLSRLLPPSTAETLKRGGKVEAEYFDSVTIYLSDIVGFTNIASRSAPLQVVKMLNELYTKLDSALDSHDVYKMETIGDAYMVVSGLPQRNGDAHCKEIAMLSLEVLQIVGSFTIPHIPAERLALRIGLHTGHVLAGVVGIKMPRYCLFGKTVAEASQMEQSGLPLRIHVSEACKSFMDKVGGFECIPREESSSAKPTYWLCGKK